MMDCDVIKDLLPLYIDGVCSEKSIELIEDHLHTCEACKAEYLLMKNDFVFEDTDIEVHEMNLLQEGKKNIEKHAKRDYESIVILIDLIFNAFIFVAGTYKIAQFAQYSIYILIYLCMIMVPTMGCEICSIYYNHSRRNTIVSTTVAYCSIIVKLLLLLMLIAVAMFGDWSYMMQLFLERLYDLCS